MKKKHILFPASFLANLGIGMLNFSLLFFGFIYENYSMQTAFLFCASCLLAGLVLQCIFIARTNPGKKGV